MVAEVLHRPSFTIDAFILSHDDDGDIRLTSRAAARVRSTSVGKPCKKIAASACWLFPNINDRLILAPNVDFESPIARLRL